MRKRALLVTIVFFLLMIGLLFMPAETVGWPAGWAFIAIFFGFNLLVVRMLARNDPALLEERMSSPIQRNQPLWDKVLVSVFLPLFVA